MENIENDPGYRLHCCDIVLSEIANEIAAAKNLNYYNRLLALDTAELIKHFRNPKGRFLLINYHKKK